MRIIRVESATLRGAGARDAIRDAEVVINRDGVVLKDRHGHVDRPATEDELAQAVAA
jgi:hypothetical protein